jgi:hypothetical protein
VLEWLEVVRERVVYCRRILLRRLFGWEDRNGRIFRNGSVAFFQFGSLNLLVRPNHYVAGWITLKAIGAFEGSALNYKAFPPYDRGGDAGNLAAWEDTPEFFEHTGRVQEKRNLPTCFEEGVAGQSTWSSLCRGPTGMENPKKYCVTGYRPIVVERHSVSLS